MLRFDAFFSNIKTLNIFHFRVDLWIFFVHKIKIDKITYYMFDKVWYTMHLCSQI